ncbi:MAG: HEAT repeat domain-containing protein [Candidatus Omnitrophota bacterium]
MRTNSNFIFGIFLFLAVLLSGVCYLHAAESENIKQWISQLSDREKRPQAIEGLIRAKQAAANDLVSALENAHTKSSAIVDIVEICEKNAIKEAVPALTNMVNAPKTRLRLATIRALGAMQDASLSEIFKKATKDTDVNIRFEALSALMKIKDKSAFSNYVESLNDADVNVRLRALDALAQIDYEQAIPDLIKKLNDRDTSVVLKTTEMLSNFKNTQVVEALINKLKTTNKAEKVATINTLAKINDKVALEHIKALANDEYKDVQLAAKNAIQALES